MLVIPGIVLALRFALINAIVVLEGAEGVSDRSFSAEVTQEKRRNTVETIVLSYS